MNDINISEVAKQIIEMMQKKGTPMTEIKQVTVSIELVDGTKITKKVDAFNYGVFINTETKE